MTQVTLCKVLIALIINVLITKTFFRYYVCDRWDVWRWAPKRTLWV